MCIFEKISKTKMYQLVKGFVGIWTLLPSIRQCQFGYYSHSNTCYLQGTPGFFQSEVSTPLPFKGTEQSNTIRIYYGREPSVAFLYTVEYYKVGEAFKTDSDLQGGNGNE